MPELQTTEQTQEIVDVTEIVERLEKAENSINEIKAELVRLGKIEVRVGDCEDSIDSIAERLRGC